jgi:hypothetical protein
MIFVSANCTLLRESRLTGVAALLLVFESPALTDRERSRRPGLKPEPESFLRGDFPSRGDLK